MSTKCTIDHGPNNRLKPDQPPNIDYHIYYECLDEDNIYLELRDCPDIQVSGSKATIAIPGRLWNHLVRLGELKSWGGEDFSNPKTQEQRNQEFKDGMDQTLAMLEEFKRKRES